MGEAKRRQRAGGPASTTPSAHSLVEQGLQWQRGKDTARAITCYWHALRLQPGHAQATHLCGLALIELGQFELGMGQLQAALSLEPGNPLFHFNLGRAHLLVGAPQAALESLERCVQIEPRHAAAHFQRAGILESMGATAAAAQAFLAAAQADPAHALAHAGAARQLYGLDHLQQAMRCQQQALALAPHLLADGVMGGVHAVASATAPGPALAEQARASARCCVPDQGPVVPELVQAVADCELLVIDDFLPNPLAHRAWAMAQRYLDQSHHVGANFPGLQTLGGAVPDGLAQVLAHRLGCDLKWGWPSHGALRYSPAGCMARSDIHVDHGDGRKAYAAVLYLSLPEHCRGGTSFWRHRETGWTQAPSDAQARDSRFGTAQTFMQALAAGRAQDFSDITQGRSDWDRLFEVPMRFNRLIAYRSDHFHAIGEVFGSRLSDGRLTQLFFFEPMGVPAAMALGAPLTTGRPVEPA